MTTMPRRTSDWLSLLRLLPVVVMEWVLLAAATAIATAIARRIPRLRREEVTCRAG